MSGDEVMKAVELLKDCGGIFSVQQKTTFECYRRNKQGTEEAVEIDILDAGLNAPADLRFTCIARSEKGKSASGNSGPDLNTVLATVHWGNLDQ